LAFGYRVLSQRISQQPNSLRFDILFQSYQVSAFVKPPSGSAFLQEQNTSLLNLRGRPKALKTQSLKVASRTPKPGSSEMKYQNQEKLAVD
jgi:hypothetical protein